MACCGPSKINIDEKKIFAQLRNIEEIIPLKLSREEYKFNPTDSKWKSKSMNYLN